MVKNPPAVQEIKIRSLSREELLEKELEEEKNEAARLAKLSEEERQQALIQKEKDDFEQEKAAFRQEQLLVEKGKQHFSICHPERTRLSKRKITECVILSEVEGSYTK